MSLLDDAKLLTTTDRREVYGHPAEDFTRIAALWTPLLGVLITPQQVGLCMIALKLARESYGHQRDTLVDIAGYASCIQDIEEVLPCTVPSVGPPSPTNGVTSSVPPVTPSLSAAVKGALVMSMEVCPTCHRFLSPSPHRCDP